MRIPFVDVYKTPPKNNIVKYRNFDIYIEKYYAMNFSLLPTTHYLTQMGIVYDYGYILHTCHIFSQYDNPSTFDVLNHLQYVYKQFRNAQISSFPRGVINDLVRHELAYIFEDDEVDDELKKGDDWMFMYAQLMTKEFQFFRHTPQSCILPIMHDVYDALHMLPAQNECLKLPFKENWQC